MPGIKREDGMEMTVKATSVQRPGTILVVDDEPAIVDLLIEILADAGYVAYSAPPGALALAAIARYPPALLLLDVRRPAMDGAALIARVREVGPRLVPEWTELLDKPFDLDHLLDCVARHVQLAQVADQRLALCTA
jgi:DNA-binding NarL/FixJ family response regulator